MSPHLLVLPSPFLGPAPYGPLVSALSSLGLSASMAPVPHRPVAKRLVTAWASLSRERGDVVLVPHSNAGYLAPAVSAVAGNSPVAFVDAALPDTAGHTRLAPAWFRSELAALVGEDGRLPKWTRWWPRSDVGATLPDPWFDRVDEVVPRVPVAYVDGEVSVPPDWWAGARGYLAFGTTYAEEWAVAERHGWPRRRLDEAGHLHLLMEPDETASALADLVAQLTTS